MRLMTPKDHNLCGGGEKAAMERQGQLCESPHRIAATSGLYKDFGMLWEVDVHGQDQRGLQLFDDPHDFIVTEGPLPVHRDHEYVWPAQTLELSWSQRMAQITEMDKTHAGDTEQKHAVLDGTA